MSRQRMLDRWCVRCGRTSPTPYTMKAIAWRKKAGLPIRSVLDLGCGNGRNLRAFQSETNATRLVGFDLCTEKAKRLCGSQLCQKVLFKEGILGQTEIPKGKFDVILLNYSLMFLSDEETAELAKQVSTRLNEGGWVVIEMYPAKDSDCPTDFDCNARMHTFIFSAGIAPSALYGTVGIARQSKNRMIIQKE